MNKLDLMILAGAGLMLTTAGGLWLSREQITIRPMEPDASFPTFQPVDVEAHEKERRRIAVTAPRGSEAETTVAFHRAARALKASPCSGSAKAAFLAALTPYARNNLRANLERARRGEEDPRSTPLEAQASEYFNMMPMSGYVTGAEFRQAMKGVTPGLGLMIAANEQTGTPMPDFGGDACERRKRGEEQPAMSWEPQPGDREPSHVRRR